jgi:hypothetical protein
MVIYYIYACRFGHNLIAGEYEEGLDIIPSLFALF